MSGAATKALARPGARTVAIIGSGVQARSHVDAMQTVLDDPIIRIWSRNPAHAEALALETHSLVAGSIEEALDGADVVCTATASPVPIVELDWLAPGAHINAVGASIASARELSSESVAAATLFVDRRESTLNESGDYLFAVQEQGIGPEHIVAEIGEVFAGMHPGRSAADELTLFKSLGIAVEDLAAAEHVSHAPGSAVSAPRWTSDAIDQSHHTPIKENPMRTPHLGRMTAIGATAIVAVALLAGAASAAAPTNTQEPSVSGSPIVGKELTGDAGNWSGTGITYAYKWLKCDSNAANCTAISGATGLHYDITSAVLGATIRFQVIATSSGDSTTANSNPTGEVTNTTGVPASSSPPVISGAATVGTTLERIDGNLGRRQADHLLVPVAALRQERQLVRFDLGCDTQRLQADPESGR